MDASGLSDYQLFELSRNPKLDPAIRELASAEMEHRKLTDEQMGLLLLKRERLFQEHVPVTLDQGQKLLLMIFPFYRRYHRFLPGQPGRYIPQNRTCKAFWRYVCIGYVVWLVGLIVVARLLRH